MGREANCEVRDGSGGPAEGLGGPPVGTRGVGRPTRRYRTGRESHPNVRAESGSSPGSPGGVGRPTRRTKGGRECHPEVPESNS